MIKSVVKDLAGRVERRVKSELGKAIAAAEVARESALTRTEPADLTSQEPEPPVVARLMVEIRSDGSRTVARGALQDEVTGEQVSLVARGNTPLELAGQLTKALMTLPLTASQLAKARWSGKAAHELQGSATAGTAAGSAARKNDRREDDDSAG